MKQFENIQLTLESTPFQGRGANSVQIMQNVFHAQGIKLSPRTIRRYFIHLETIGDVICTGTDGKWKLYCRPPQKDPGINKEMAFVLCELEQDIRKRFPEQVVEMLEEYLLQAQAKVGKVTSLSPNDKLVRFQKMMAGINISSYLMRKGANDEVLRAVVDAIYEEKELAIKVDGSAQECVMSNVRLEEMDGRLFIRGLSVTDNRMLRRVELARTTSATVMNYCVFQLPLNLRRAA